MSPRPLLSVVRTPAGNFGRLCRGLERAGARTRLVAAGKVGRGGEDAIVLAGVSSFSTISRSVGAARRAIRGAVAEGQPVLGVCAGFQVLFDSSEEGAGRGLSLLPGRVVRLRSPRVPNLGWSRLGTSSPHGRLTEGLPDGSYAYFAHSYRAPLPPGRRTAPGSTVVADYRGERFPAAVEQGRLWGLQFHPELSSTTGAKVLSNFVALCQEARA